MELTKKMTEDAHKVAFLVENYPDKTLSKVIEALQMPAIRINTSIWAAVELGYIEDPETTEGIMIAKALPTEYHMGDSIDELEAMLTFSFQCLAKREKDLEENYLSNWTLGYDGHDVLIALKDLLNKHVLASYQLTDPKDTKSTYTFYSLYENSEQMWGRKNFEVQPTGEEKPDDSEGPIEEVTDGVA